MFIISDATELAAGHHADGVERNKEHAFLLRDKGVKQREVSPLVYCQPVFSVRSIFSTTMTSNPDCFTASPGITPLIWIEIIFKSNLTDGCFPVKQNVHLVGSLYASISLQ